LANTQKIVEKQ